MVFDERFDDSLDPLVAAEVFLPFPCEAECFGKLSEERLVIRVEDVRSDERRVVEFVFGQVRKQFLREASFADAGVEYGAEGAVDGVPH